MPAPAANIFDQPDVIILSTQRSGTHFLESSLASHPLIHKRGECVLRYRLDGANPKLDAVHRQGRIFTNRPNRTNLAIVMYSEVALLEKLCGPLEKQKIIHLLRDPESVARSVLQKDANKNKYQERYRAHYKLNEKVLPDVAFDRAKVKPLTRQIAAEQKKFIRRLKGHPHLFVIHYEDIAGQGEVNILPKKFTREILKFLQLPYHPLSNDLKKTGPNLLKRDTPLPPAAPASAPINLVFLYYDNPEMLRAQIDCWNSYVGVLQTLPTILLIDDGSPHTFAAEIVRDHGCHVPIKVFRIQEDIRWNFTGARNLGCSQAKGWIYISDIDTQLPASAAQQFFESAPLDPNCFYIPRRVWLPKRIEASPPLVNLFFHKKKYLEIGGYDEDYAGHYGREETDFFRRLRRAATKVVRDDVCLEVVPHSMIGDSRTRGRKRDKTRNIALFDKKEAAGFPNPVNPLRFTWKRVL